MQIPLRSNNIENTVMKRGKRICNTLKEVRMQVAKANEIKYAPTECHHEGDCAGTCPSCEAEVRYLEQQLQLRRQLGKAVAVVGVSMGLVALTSCEINQNKRTDLDNLQEMLSQLQEPGGHIDTVRDTLPVMSQDNDSNVIELVGDVVEPQPSFPGGQEALLKFLKENVKYPEQAEADSVSGRVVVSFVIRPNGSVTDPRIENSVHPLLDAEALRVISLMPKWESGHQNGIPVSIRYNLPITFELE